MGDNTKPAKNNRREVDRQVTEEISISQKNSKFGGIMEEVLGMVQTEQQWLTAKI